MSLRGPIMRPTLEEVLADLEVKVGTKCQALWGLSENPQEAKIVIEPVLRKTERRLTKLLGGKWKAEWLGVTRRPAVSITQAE